MQGSTMNKDININEASGVGYTVEISLQTTHYSSEGEDKRIYTFCITTYRPSWTFSFYSCYLLYSTSNLFGISSYVYLFLISTHDLLLSAEIIFWAIFFVICMRAFLHFMEIVDGYSFWALVQRSIIKITRDICEMLSGRYLWTK